jgi:hypothetical protein
MNSESPTLHKQDKFEAIFTGDGKLASGYGDVVEKLALKNTKKSIKFNASKDDWLDLKFAQRTKDNIQYNLDANKKHLRKLVDNGANDGIIAATKENIRDIELRLSQYNEDIVNPEYIKLREHFKNQDNVATDDIASYLENSNLDNIQIKNVLDGDFGDINISKQVSGNYLKSLKGNILLDMTNPNIHKSLVPGAIGVGAVASQIQGNKELPKQQDGGLLDNYSMGGTHRRSDTITSDKNIQTAINYLFLRNRTLYGDRRRQVYKPKINKYQDGGSWLSNYED